MLSSVRWRLSMYSGREKPAAYKLLPVEKLLPTYCGPCTNVNCVYPLWSSVQCCREGRALGPDANVLGARKRVVSFLRRPSHPGASSTTESAGTLQGSRAASPNERAGLAGTYTQKKKTKDNCQKWPQAPERSRDHPLESSAT